MLQYLLSLVHSIVLNVKNYHWGLHEEPREWSYTTDLTLQFLRIHYGKMARIPAILLPVFLILGKDINLVIPIIYLVLFCSPLIDRHPLMLVMYLWTTGLAVRFIWDYYTYYYIIVVLYNSAVCCTLLILRPIYNPSFRI